MGLLSWAVSWLAQGNALNLVKPCPAWHQRCVLPMFQLHAGTILLYLGSKTKGFPSPHHQHLSWVVCILPIISSVAFSVWAELATGMYTWTFLYVDLNVKPICKAQMCSWIIHKSKELSLVLFCENTNGKSSPVTLGNLKCKSAQINYLLNIATWRKAFWARHGKLNAVILYRICAKVSAEMGWVFWQLLQKGGKADYFYWILLFHSCGWDDVHSPFLLQNYIVRC